MATNLTKEITTLLRNRQKLLNERSAEAHQKGNLSELNEIEEELLEAEKLLRKLEK